MKIHVSKADLPGRAWLAGETYADAGDPHANVVVDPSKIPLDPVDAIFAAVTLGMIISGSM